MKKRLIGMAMAAVLAMTALTGCGTAEDTSSLDSLTFTYVTSPLNLPSIIEKEKGIFTKAFADDGIEVKYTEITSGADQTQALAAGDVQVLYAVGATSVILSAANACIPRMKASAPLRICAAKPLQALSAQICMNSWRHILQPRI